MPAGLHRRLRLGQQTQSLRDLADVPGGLGEQDQPARARQLLPRGQDGRQALAELRQTRIPLALHGPCPPLPAGAIPHEERKPLRRRQGQQGLGLRLDRWHLVAAVMQVARPVLGQGQTMGMGQLLGQSQRLLTPPHCLFRIAQAPQREGHTDKTRHPRHHAMVERQGPLCRQVGEGEALFQVRPGAPYSPRKYKVVPSASWASRRDVGTAALRQAIELFPQLSRRRQRPPAVIEQTQAAQRLEELGRLADLAHSARARA